MCPACATLQRFPDSLSPAADYEQQRLHLLHKHGIDLEDNFAPSDGTRTKRLDRKEVERLMGGNDGQGGIFTWRERNRRKVRAYAAVPQFLGPSQCFSHTAPAAGIFRVGLQFSRR